MRMASREWTRRYSIRTARRSLSMARRSLFDRWVRVRSDRRRAVAPAGSTRAYRTRYARLGSSRKPLTDRGKLARFRTRVSDNASRACHLIDRLGCGRLDTTDPESIRRAHLGYAWWRWDTWRSCPPCSATTAGVPVAHAELRDYPRTRSFIAAAEAAVITAGTPSSTWRTSRRAIGSPRSFAGTSSRWTRSPSGPGITRRACSAAARIRADSWA
jgi:hypothetical protein